MKNGKNCEIQSNEQQKLSVEEINQNLKNNEWQMTY